MCGKEWIMIQYNGVKWIHVLRVDLKMYFLFFTQTDRAVFYIYSHILKIIKNNGYKNVKIFKQYIY